MADDDDETPVAAVGDGGDGTDPTERVWMVVLARAAWRNTPVVRLHATAGRLQVDMVGGETTCTRRLDRDLLVELDHDDENAHLVTLRLNRAASDSRAVLLARDLLGPVVWSAAERLMASGERTQDVVLTTTDAARCIATWHGRAGGLLAADHLDDCVIGVEVKPGRVTVAVVGADATVHDVAVDRPTENDPDSIVAAIGRAVAELAKRYPGTAVEDCAVGVQIGGPVDDEHRIVESYNKPLHPHDETWKDVKLAAKIERVTGRSAIVRNDAAALAELEILHGVGRRQQDFAVLIVGQGVGAKLVHKGVLTAFPMEIGVVHQGTVPLEKRTGVRAMIDGVARVCRDPSITDLGAAVRAAEVDGRAARLFRDIGRWLARGIAPIQAVVNPPIWVVCLPEELIGESSVAWRELMTPLRAVNQRVEYSGIGVHDMVVRTLDGSTGARAAAVAARVLLGAR